MLTHNQNPQVSSQITLKTKLCKLYNHINWIQYRCIELFIMVTVHIVPQYFIDKMQLVKNKYLNINEARRFTVTDTMSTYLNVSYK